MGADSQSFPATLPSLSAQHHLLWELPLSCLSVFITSTEFISVRTEFWLPMHRVGSSKKNNTWFESWVKGNVTLKWKRRYCSDSRKMALMLKNELVTKSTERKTDVCSWKLVSSVRVCGTESRAQHKGSHRHTAPRRSCGGVRAATLLKCVLVSLLLSLPLCFYKNG